MASHASVLTSFQARTLEAVFHRRRTSWIESAHRTTMASHTSPVTSFQTRTLEAAFRRKLDHPLLGPRATWRLLISRPVK